jgi:hypothetical protein
MPLAVWYRGALAVMCVAGFFTNLLNYLYITGRSPAQPAIWVVVLLLFTLPLAGGRDAWRVLLASPVIWWCAFYAATTALWFMWSSQSDTATGEVVTRLGSVIFLGTALFILTDARVHHVTRVALLATAFLGVALNVVDILRPLTFSPIPGRAAGLLVNPNGSAITLCLAMIMTVEIVRPGLRSWYVWLVGAGVLLTFSRGGAAVWLFAVCYLMVERIVRPGAIVRGLALAALLAVGGLFLTDRLDLGVEVAAAIASETTSGLRLDQDLSADPRFGDAIMAWQMFLDRPLMGNGVGATAEWDRFESAHNIYLRHLAEYGVVGSIIVPLLACALLWRPGGSRSRVAGLVAGAALLWGMVSHNILDERQFLLCIALAAAMPSHERSLAPAGQTADAGLA